MITIIIPSQTGRSTEEKKYSALHPPSTFRLPSIFFFHSLNVSLSCSATPLTPKSFLNSPLPSYFISYFLPLLPSTPPLSLHYSLPSLPSPSFSIFLNPPPITFSPIFLFELSPFLMFPPMFLLNLLLSIITPFYVKIKRLLVRSHISGKRHLQLLQARCHMEYHFRH